MTMASSEKVTGSEQKDSLKMAGFVYLSFFSECDLLWPAFVEGTLIPDQGRREYPLAVSERSSFTAITSIAWGKTGRMLNEHVMTTAGARAFEIDKPSSPWTYELL